MWKIFIVYGDTSKLTLTGKHPDIPLRLALQYQKEYASRKSCTATYQRYPKSKHPEMTLAEKINELETIVI